MRWILVVLAVGCGGSSLEIGECDPCQGASAMTAPPSVSGDTVTCACASGGTPKGYQRTLETTAACANDRSEWIAYADAACR